MKRMHFAPPEVRAKICQLLENNGQELIHLSYGSADCKNLDHYVGIAFKYSITTSEYTAYSVFTYNSKTDILTYQEKDLYYENALIEMGGTIKSISFLN